LTVSLVSYAALERENGIMIRVGPLTAQGGENNKCGSFRNPQSAAGIDQNPSLRFRP
jgi:hypothetical protein